MNTTALAVNRPCHVCFKIVAHYGPPSSGFRGSRKHKCPHGVDCPGGSRLHRWAHIGLKRHPCRDCYIEQVDPKRPGAIKPTLRARLTTWRPGDASPTQETKP